MHYHRQDFDHMTKKFLLVCEGPSDIPIFRRIAKKLGGDIYPVSPIPDATSNKYPPHGWTEVSNWCRRMATVSQTGNPIDFYLKWKGADGLIIQIDTDIADKINLGGAVGAKGDKIWCTNAINQWLGSRAGHACTYYILSTFSTETWIAATYSNHKVGYAKGSLKDYEQIPDPQAKLLALGYKGDGGGKLKKSEKQYEQSRYAPRLVDHLGKARVRCKELEKYVSLFS